MREAQCVYVTVSENEGEIYFDGQTPAELKTYIKKMKWLKWERRLSVGKCFFGEWDGTVLSKKQK